MTRRPRGPPGASSLIAVRGAGGAGPIAHRRASSIGGGAMLMPRVRRLSSRGRASARGKPLGARHEAGHAWAFITPGRSSNGTLSGSTTTASDLGGEPLSSGPWREASSRHAARGPTGRWGWRRIFVGRVIAGLVAIGIPVSPVRKFVLRLRRTRPGRSTSRCILPTGGHAGGVTTAHLTATVATLIAIVAATCTVERQVTGPAPLLGLAFLGLASLASARCETWPMEVRVDPGGTLIRAKAGAFTGLVEYPHEGPLVTE